MGKKNDQEKKIKIIMNEQNSIIELISKSENTKPTIKINGQVVTDEQKLSEKKHRNKLQPSLLSVKEDSTSNSMEKRSRSRSPDLTNLFNAVSVDTSTTNKKMSSVCQTTSDLAH